MIDSTSWPWAPCVSSSSPWACVGAQARTVLGSLCNGYLPFHSILWLYSRPPPLKAFATQPDLADAPLLAPPTPSTSAAAAITNDEAKADIGDSSRALLRQDTPVRVVRSSGRVLDVDVDALIEETAVATDAARALEERVEVLERALQVRGVEGQCPVVVRRDSDSNGNAQSESDQDRHANKVIEDELRLQLRRVEAERDKAQRIVRDMRTYLLDESTIQRG